MPASIVLREDNTKPDGSRYEMVAWAVPESEDFPEGLKYSFQYMDADGETLLRFDNSPYHLAVGRHHRHTPAGAIEPLEYTGLSDLVEQFQTEVTELYARRSN
jgi:hypothetical protein